MPISPLPQPPTRQDPSNFAQRGDDFLAALPVFAAQANALAEDVSADEANVAAMAALVLPASTAALAAANYVGVWSTLSGSLALPKSVYHAGRFWVLLNPVANVAASQPGVSADWSAISDDVGMTGFFPFSSAPPGWLKANGAAVSRTAYAALYARASAMGSFAVDAADWAANPGKFYVGNGTTTFNLPDLRADVIRALDDGKGIDASRGLGTLQQPQNMAHTHTGTTGTESQGHNHTVTVNTASLTGQINFRESGPVSASGIAAASDSSTNFDGGGAYGGTRGVSLNASHAHTTSVGGASANHTHSFTTASSGGTETRVRTTALLACIKY